MADKLSDKDIRDLLEATRKNLVSICSGEDATPRIAARAGEAVAYLDAIQGSLSTVTTSNVQ
jgi:hypothetical protein